jgi:FkbM family methyltransferase
LQIAALAVTRLRFQRDTSCFRFILLTPFLYLIGFRGILDTGLARVRAENRQELRAIMYGFFKTYFCYLYVLTERFRLHSFSTVVDVGANMGDFAIAMSGKSQTIIAIEPGRENFNRLRGNIEKNSIKNVVAINVAAHDRNQKLFLGGNNSDRHVALIGGEVVQAMPLDTLLDTTKVPEIDILKIDVQGHEEYVLSGLRNCFDKGRVKLTIVELHPKRGVSRSSIIDMMNSIGYDLVHEDSYLFDQPQLYFRKSPSAIMASKSSDETPYKASFPDNLMREDSLGRFRLNSRRR